MGLYNESLENRILLHPGHGFHVEVNFQPSSAAVPSAYIADTGFVYSARPNGLTYGWDAENSPATRKRNANSDQRYDTLTHLQQNGQSRKWEIAVPNGFYLVRVVAGDPSFWDSVYKLNVENTLVVNGTPTSANRFIEGNATVQVSDGKLTITNASGSKNNKLAFVDIQETSAPTNPTPPPPTGSGLRANVNFQPSFSLVPSGHIADTGFVFSARPNGQTYGWDIENSPATRQRNSSSDLRFDTLAHMQPGGQARKWEFAVPSGYYNVRVVAGDPSFWDSVYKINVEGTLVVNGTPSSSNRFIEGTATVQVTDGRLTLTSASGSQNNKLAFVEITQVEAPTTPQPPPPPPEPPPTSVSAGWSQVAPLPLARTEAQQAVKNGLLYIFGGFFNGSWQATKRIDVYDPATDKWTYLGEMPVALTHAASVMDGNNVILLGGFVGNDPGPATNQVWMYNVHSKAWSQLPNLPGPRGGGGAGIVGTKLYFFGGGTRNAQLKHDVDYGTTWELDLANVSAGWKTKATMPIPRNHLAFATVGNLIYSIGGQILDRETTGNQSAVHAYNPATNTWSSVASLPKTLGHVHAGAVVQDGRIILAGGVSNGYVTQQSILSYDPPTNTWTYVRDLAVPRKSANVMIHNGHIYVAGGGNNSATSTVYKAGWAPTWHKMANMPVSMGEVAAGVINGKMYVIGESNNSTAVYDIAKNTWSTSSVPTRPFLGHHHAAEVLGGKWYIIGGLGSSAGKLQIYNPASNSWSQGAAMPYDGGSVASSVIGGKIYVAGGIVGSTATNGAGTGTTNQAAVYNPATNSWSSIAPMPLGVNHAAAATDGQRMFVFGGRDGKNVVGNGFSTVQIYNPATNTWVSSNSNASIAPMPIGRGGTGKAVFYNGEFYVFGGETLTGPGATADKVYSRVDIYNASTNQWRLGPAMPTARHGIFPVLHAGRIYVAAGGVKAAFSNSNVNEVLQVG